jgi:thiol-disulfide isomerase/thioredoxin
VRLGVCVFISTDITASTSPNLSYGCSHAYQCTFCKRMKADWEQLAEEWDDHAYGLVAEVDCTDEDNGEFCRDQGVTGYPTLKYGDPLDLKEYNGGRSYRALADFAAEHLVAPCSPRYPDECDDQTLELFAKYMDMPVEQLDARIAALEKEHDEADEALEREVLRLKDMYDKLYAEKEAKLAVDQGLSILESIHRVQQAAAVTDEL